MTVSSGLVPPFLHQPPAIQQRHVNGQRVVNLRLELQRCRVPRVEFLAVGENCHFTDTPCKSLSKHLVKLQAGAIK